MTDAEPEEGVLTIDITPNLDAWKRVVLMPLDVRLVWERREQ